MKKNITIADIAQEANVSTATVSRVISGTTRVKDTTRERVEAVIRKYDYEINSIAQSLTKKKTHTIGVIVLDINNLFFSEVIKGINEVAREHEYDVFLANTDFEEERELHFTKAFIRRNTDGILISPVAENSEGIRLLNKKKIPFFVLNCRINNPDINYVTNDNIAGAYLATDYLISLGHREIAFLHGYKIQGFIERLKGYKKALKENNIAYSDKLVFGYGENDEDGLRLTKDLLSSKQSFSAIFASNDMMAIGAMEAIYESGKRIPDDISLVGYDNLSITKNLKIPLTTINQPKFEQGKLAAESLMSLINENTSVGYSSHLIMKPELVIRDSCRKL
jgi:LacI family transcriptional regulator